MSDAPVDRTGVPVVASRAEEPDWYMDGEFLVFNRAYHLRRGYCCGNSCRHCPYDENGVPAEGKGEREGLSGLSRYNGKD